MPQPPFHLVNEPVSGSGPRRIQFQRSPPHSQASGTCNTGTSQAPTATMTPESSCSNARSASSEGVDSDTPLTADSRPAKRKRPIAKDPNRLPRRHRRHTAGDDGVAHFQSHMNDVSGNIDDLWENMTSVAMQHTIFRNDTKNFHAMQEVQLKAHDKNIEEIWVWVKRRDGVPAKLETLKAQVNEMNTAQEQRNEQLQQEMRDMKLTFAEALKKGVAEQINKFENRIEKLEADHDVRDVATKNHQRRIEKLEEARVKIDDDFKTIKDTLPTLATTKAMTQLVKDAQDATNYECKKRNAGLESSIETKLDTTNTKLNTTNAKLETHKTSLEDFQNAVSKVLILQCVRREEPVPQAPTAPLTPASTSTISPPQPRPETQSEPQKLPNGTPSSPITAITLPMEDSSFSAHGQNSFPSPSL
ncbi:hypothetical protein BDU57DRAFT_252031 [Ampelomyces quisqualis]|uniref:Uncharacterized protein n=1 Tax=Ampelomyces quisqualis TaxID=50730 RepID=A0A6A5QNN3_AMPQU|nr:hypothetical protein BDU57DRAFT_252031 [Ampelomyces quisqualis]